LKLHEQQLELQNKSKLKAEGYETVMKDEINGHVTGSTLASKEISSPLLMEVDDESMRTPDNINAIPHISSPLRSPPSSQCCRFVCGGWMIRNSEGINWKHSAWEIVH